MVNDDAVRFPHKSFQGFNFCRQRSSNWRNPTSNFWFLWQSSLEWNKLSSALILRRRTSHALLAFIKSDTWWSALVLSTPSVQSSLDQWWSISVDSRSSCSELSFTWESSATCFSGDHILTTLWCSLLFRACGVLEMPSGKHRSMVKSNWKGVLAYTKAHFHFFRIVWNTFQTKQGSRFLKLPIMGISWFRHRLCLLNSSLRKNEALFGHVSSGVRSFLLHHRRDSSAEKSK